MSNAPVVDLSFYDKAVTADSEVFERFLRWQDEVYSPILMKIPGMQEINRIETVHHTFEYPKYGSLLHWENLKARENFETTVEGKSIHEEVNVWVNRGVRQTVWSATYELIKSYQSTPLSLVTKQGTENEGASVVSLEAYRFSKEDEEKYFNWFNAFGSGSFVPLFVKLPGVKRYDWYQDTGIRRRQDSREHEYPKYLSITYFENVQAFDNFIDSQELAGFLKMLGSVFPYGLNYKWYIQYEVTKSWRK